jgi:hypothetical protein
MFNQCFDRMSASSPGGDKLELAQPFVTNTRVLPIQGLFYFPNFIDKAEERDLVQFVDQKPYSKVRPKSANGNLSHLAGRLAYWTTPRTRRPSTGVSNFMVNAIIRQRTTL